MLLKKLSCKVLAAPGSSLSARPCRSACLCDSVPDLLSQSTAAWLLVTAAVVVLSPKLADNSCKQVL